MRRLRGVISVPLLLGILFLSVLIPTSVKLSQQTTQTKTKADEICPPAPGPDNSAVIPVIKHSTICQNNTCSVSGELLEVNSNQNLTVNFIQKNVDQAAVSYRLKNSDGSVGPWQEGFRMAKPTGSLSFPPPEQPGEYQVLVAGYDNFCKWACSSKIYYMGHKEKYNTGDKCEATVYCPYNGSDFGCNNTPFLIKVSSPPAPTVTPPPPVYNSPDLSVEVGDISDNQWESCQLWPGGSYSNLNIDASYPNTTHWFDANNTTNTINKIHYKGTVDLQWQSVFRCDYQKLMEKDGNVKECTSGDEDTWSDYNDKPHHKAEAIYTTTAGDTPNLHELIDWSHYDGQCQVIQVDIDGCPGGVKFVVYANDICEQPSPTPIPTNTPTLTPTVTPINTPTPQPLVCNQLKLSMDEITLGESVIVTAQTQTKNAQIYYRYLDDSEDTRCIDEENCRLLTSGHRNLAHSFIPTKPGRYVFETNVYSDDYKVLCSADHFTYTNTARNYQPDSGWLPERGTGIACYTNPSTDPICNQYVCDSGTRCLKYLTVNPAATPTPTNTPTNTPIPTMTPTNTPTPTQTLTPTPTSTPIPPPPCPQINIKCNWDTDDKYINRTVTYTLPSAPLGYTTKHIPWRYKTSSLEVGVEQMKRDINTAGVWLWGNTDHTTTVEKFSQLPGPQNCSTNGDKKGLWYFGTIIEYDPAFIWTPCKGKETDCACIRHTGSTSVPMTTAPSPVSSSTYKDCNDCPPQSNIFNNCFFKEDDSYCLQYDMNSDGLVNVLDLVYCTNRCGIYLSSPSPSIGPTPKPTASPSNQSTSGFVNWVRNFLNTIF